MKISALLASLASGAMFMLAQPAFAQDEEATRPPPIAIIPVPDEEPAEDAITFPTEEEEELAALEKEMTEAFAIFGELFKADPLTEEQEARLPLAEQLSALALPEGSLGQALEQSIAPMLKTMMSLDSLDKRGELSRLTGVAREDLDAVEDRSVNQALDIFDPDFEARKERIVEMTTNMTAQLFEAMEPAYREAIARAYAVRFTEAEMSEILAFAQTGSGQKFTEFGFLMQYDPQIIAAVQAMGPAMAKVLPEMMEEAAAVDEEMPAAFSYIELSPLEREMVAELLGKSESELEALAPVPGQIEEETEATVI